MNNFSAKLDDAVTGQQSEFVLVPRVPTPAMLEHGWYGAHEEDAAATWHLMLQEWERSVIEGIDQSTVALEHECENG